MRTPAWVAIGRANSGVNDAPIRVPDMSGLRAVPSARGNRVGGQCSAPAAAACLIVRCLPDTTRGSSWARPVCCGPPGGSDGAVRRCLWTSSRAIGGAYEGHSFFRLVDPLGSGDHAGRDRIQAAFACCRVLCETCWRRTSRRPCCPRPMPTSLHRTRRVGGAADGRTRQVARERQAARSRRTKTGLAALHPLRGGARRPLQTSRCPDASTPSRSAHLPTGRRATPLVVQPRGSTDFDPAHRGARVATLLACVPRLRKPERTSAVTRSARTLPARRTRASFRGARLVSRPQRDCPRARAATGAGANCATHNPATGPRAR